MTFTNEIPGDEVLTPSHLIYGRRINTISINQREEEHRHFEGRFIHLSNDGSKQLEKSKSRNKGYQKKQFTKFLLHQVKF